MQKSRSQQCDRLSGVESSVILLWRLEDVSNQPDRIRDINEAVAISISAASGDRFGATKEDEADDVDSVRNIGIAAAVGIAGTARSELLPESLVDTVVG